MSTNMEKNKVTKNLYLVVIVVDDVCLGLILKELQRMVQEVGTLGIRSVWGGKL